VTALAVLMVAICAIGMPLAARPQSHGDIIELWTDGKRRMSFSARERPASSTNLTPFCFSLFPKDVRRADGEIVRGVGFNAWKVGDKTLVLAVMLTPKRQARTSMPLPSDFTYTELQRIALSLGESKPIDQLKTLGVPMTMMLKLIPAGSQVE
jgi:hypothetical protein